MPPNRVEGFVWLARLQGSTPAAVPQCRRALVPRAILLGLDRVVSLGLSHYQWPEKDLGLVGIVPPTPQCQVLKGCRTAGGERHEVMELEPPAFSAPPLCADERALPLVACPDLALDGGRYVTRSGRGWSRR